MTESTEAPTRTLALSLDDWTTAYGDPPREALEQERPVFVVPADDPCFGSTSSRWVEFTGAMCDDGGVLVGTYEFHRVVRRGPLRARLVASVQGATLSKTAPRLFAYSRPSDSWGFFIVEPDGTAPW